MEKSIEKGEIVSDENANHNSLNQTKQTDNSLLQDHFASYDNSIVASKLQTIWKNKLNVSFFNLKYLSQSIFGKTWHILLCYLLAYYTVQVLYQLKYLTRFCNNHMFNEPNNQTTTACDQMIVDWFTHWQESDRMMLSTITFLLGFFVNHIVKRWWEQVSRVPRIESIILGLSGLVWPSKHPNGGEQSITLFRKTILRYCLLSWAMAFRKFSNIRSQLYNENDFIRKGLLTTKEYNALSSNGKEGIWWIDRWCVPLTWAIYLVNNASNKTKIVPKDHKDLISLMSRYQKDLQTIIEHADNPTPILYRQAVNLAVWSFLILGVISGK